jgi:hypothetical protein
VLAWAVADAAAVMWVCGWCRCATLRQYVHQSTIEFQQIREKLLRYEQNGVDELKKVYTHVLAPAPEAGGESSNQTSVARRRVGEDRG